MPSRATPRHRGTALREQLAAGLLVGVAASAPLGAQELSAQTSATISIRVGPSLAIRGVLPGATRREGGHGLTASSTVDVEANLPYRVAVRLAPESTGDRARVLVRNASGAFEALLPDASVTTAVSPAAGRRGHEIVCRVETAEPTPIDASRCTLVYELSAEYHDTLLRTSVSVLGAGVRERAAGNPSVSIQAVGPRSSRTY